MDGRTLQLYNRFFSNIQMNVAYMEYKLREFDFPFTLYKLLTRYFTRSTNRGTLKNE